MVLVYGAICPTSRLYKALATGNSFQSIPNVSNEIPFGFGGSCFCSKKCADGHRLNRNTAGDRSYQRYNLSFISTPLPGSIGLTNWRFPGRDF